jgi:hypothetical protein
MVSLGLHLQILGIRLPVSETWFERVGGLEGLLRFTRLLGGGGLWELVLPESVGAEGVVYAGGGGGGEGGC